MSRILRSVSLLCAAFSVGVIYLALVAAPASASSIPGGGLGGGGGGGGCAADPCVLSAQCPYSDPNACDYPDFCQCLDGANGEGTCGCAGLDG